MVRSALATCLLLFAAPQLLSAAPQERLVLIDQDGSGPGGSNQMAMMALLQSPQVKVLGITMVSGNAWEPEEVQHTLRMLELIHRTDVPVVPGAIFPLVRTQQETMLWQQALRHHRVARRLGRLRRSRPAQRRSTRPRLSPPLAEGEPTTQPLAEDAAHFLIRQVHAHPHQVTIYAAGPLTNIALALSIDPDFAAAHPGHRHHGRQPQPHHQRSRVHHRSAPRVQLLVRSRGRPHHAACALASHRSHHRRYLHQGELHASDAGSDRHLAQSRRAVHRSLLAERYYLWDELAAAAWLDPAIITAERRLYLDVDLSHGATYGDTLAWTEANKPDLDLQLVHVQTDLDLPRFTRMFVSLMQSSPQHN